MYVSKVLVDGINKNLVMQIRNLFNELGYPIVNYEPDIIISVNSINYTIRKYFRKFHNKIIINVVQDGSSVIPLTKEHLGGSLLASFLADSLGSNLILTTPTGVKGLYSVEEFSWLNGLSISNYNYKIASSLNRKLVKDGKINIYVDSYEGHYTVYEGYNVVKDERDADLILTNAANSSYIIKSYNTINNNFILIPAGIYVGLRYLESTPLEVLVYSIKMTLKSLYILNNRVDYIVVPQYLRNDKKLDQLAKYYSSSIVYVNEAEDFYSCNTLLEKIGVKVLLREVKRAFGVMTCLGVKN
ncbi:cobalamin biosynthesis protein CbiG [Sulfolobus tengchongensis]|uniref:Cobalamin biosynthesis protein CbiG n=1 Tax=Sulfolobus tengchongensis TaxID=207809 RepID=A0AAX4KYV4_9CREN